MIGNLQLLNKEARIDKFETLPNNSGYVLGYRGNLSRIANCNVPLLFWKSIFREKRIDLL